MYLSTVPAAFYLAIAIFLPLFGATVRSRGLNLSKSTDQSLPNICTYSFTTDKSLCPSIFWSRNISPPFNILFSECISVKAGWGLFYALTAVICRWHILIGAYIPFVSVCITEYIVLRFALSVFEVFPHDICQCLGKRYDLGGAVFRVAECYHTAVKVYILCLRLRAVEIRFPVPKR